MKIQTNKIKLPFGLRLARLGMQRSVCNIKVGACLIDKGRIIIAWNKDKTDPYVKQYGYAFDEQNHAEYGLLSRLQSLLIKLGEVTNVTPMIDIVSSRAVCYVYRESALGLPALAKPCKSCAAILAQMGLKKVVYSTTGCWTESKMEDM